MLVSMKPATFSDLMWGIITAIALISVIPVWLIYLPFWGYKKISRKLSANSL